MQDWLYDEGEDATKAIYQAKIDEIRAIGGPIAQRYLDKFEEERQAALKAQEEAAAKKRAEQEAIKQAQEEQAAAAAAAAKMAAQREAQENKDSEMPDAGEEKSA